MGDFVYFFLVSCGGGGGGSSGVANNQPIGDTEAVNLDEETGNDQPGEDSLSHDDVGVVDILPVPAVIPIPLDESDPPILLGNIFSTQDTHPTHSEKLYLIDEAKSLQGLSDVLFQTNNGHFSVSWDSLYLSYVPFGGSRTVVNSIEGDRLCEVSRACNFKWLPDDCALFSDGDHMRITHVDIFSQTETLVHQAVGGNLTDLDSLAVSPDGKYIVWAEHHNDYEISIFWAQFDGRQIIGSPQLIWNGVTPKENTSCGSVFFTNEKFVFFLRQPDEDGSGNFSDYVFEADISKETAKKVFHNFIIREPVVSKEGNFIIFQIVRSIVLISTKSWQSESIDYIGGKAGGDATIFEKAWSPKDEYLLVAARGGLTTILYLYPFPALDRKWNLTSLDGTTKQLQWIEY